MTKTRKFRSKNCNPNVKGKTIKKQSCMTTNALMKVRKYYNKYNPHSKINTQQPHRIWSELKRKLHHCDNEICWLDEFRDINLKSYIKNKLFSPSKPADWKNNPRKWISNYDILKVLAQYENKFPFFKLMNPTTLDFDERYSYGLGGCISNEICTFNLNDMIERGFTKIGFIFNLSKRHQKGSHWVSLFVDITKKYILYFDSNGNESPDEVTTLTKRIMLQGKQLTNPIEFEYTQNKISHQRSNTECGMYSLYFMITQITESISGKSASKNRIFNHLLNRRIDDNYVFKYRNIYFNE